jgi:hypothetical protein
MTFPSEDQLSQMSPAERKRALKKALRPYLIRLSIVSVIAVILAFGFNELTFYFQKEAFDRQPETITVVIPAGTAKRVENGETPPEIPSDLTFVFGDTLEVVNKDQVPHQLGPVFIPAGSAARIQMDNIDQYSYTCSFRSNNYLGIEVKQSTTLNIRFTGLMLVAPTTAVLLFLYSLVVVPIKASPEKSSMAT